MVERWHVNWGELLGAEAKSLLLLGRRSSQKRLVPALGLDDRPAELPYGQPVKDRGLTSVVAACYEGRRSRCKFELTTLELLKAMKRDFLDDRSRLRSRSRSAF